LLGDCDWVNAHIVNDSPTTFLPEALDRPVIGGKRSHQKLWRAPIIIAMLLHGGLLILAQGSVVAPFIDKLF
jgi:hypothetical protein